MFNLIFSRQLGANAIPRRLTTLSVSWINSQFKAVAVHRGVVEATWEHPEPVEGTTHFEALIREAVEKTGYHGLSVSLLLAHPRLVQQLVEVPPVKGSALRKILQRQAQQQKMVAGEAAWACQSLVAGGKGDQRVVMHLFPRMLLNHLVQGCHRNGLYLVSVLPTAAVLQQQIRQFPLGKTDVVLLAAETVGSTTVAIGAGDGRVLLARTLPGTWNDNAERLALDLNRTVLFVNQQYGVSINRGIWLFGPGAQEQLKTVQQHLQLPVDTSPATYNPFYWATEALKLRPSSSPNFITPELQKAAQRQAFAKVVAVATLFLVLALVAVSVYASLQSRQERENIRILNEQYNRLQTQKNDLLQHGAELARRRHVASLVLDNRPPPVPVWLLGYLSEVTPSELVITNLHVKHEEDAWRVYLAGTYQAAIREPTPELLSDALTAFSQRLSNGPFHLRVISEKEKLAAKPKPSLVGGLIPSWVANVSSGVQAKNSASEFALEGVMQ